MCRVLNLLGAAAGSTPYMLRAAGSGRKKGVVKKANLYIIDRSFLFLIN